MSTRELFLRQVIYLIWNYKNSKTLFLLSASQMISAELIPKHQYTKHTINILLANEMKIDIK